MWWGREATFKHVIFIVQSKGEKCFSIRFKAEYQNNIFFLIYYKMLHSKDTFNESHVILLQEVSEDSQPFSSIIALVSDFEELVAKTKEGYSF